MSAKTAARKVKKAVTKAKKPVKKAAATCRKRKAGTRKATPKKTDGSSLAADFLGLLWGWLPSGPWNSHRAAYSI